MPLNKVYQVRARQHWGGSNKPFESVFFFEHTAGEGNWGDLAEVFGTTIGAKINDLQTTTVHNDSIDVINLGDPVDFGFALWAGLGAYDESALPPYAAIGFTFKLNTRAVRHGGKRISGIPESVADNGKIVDAAYRAKRELLRLVMQQELVDADNTWLPVVVKRIRTPVAGTVPQQYKYALPKSGDPLVLGEVVAVLTSDDLSHQVSREV